jgi:hypothetical protein
MKTTRTIIAIIDDFEHYPGTTPEQIVEHMTDAAERYYADRDDVVEFEIRERQRDYSNVQLPLDYVPEEQQEVLEIAWRIYSGELPFFAKC